MTVKELTRPRPAVGSMPLSFEAYEAELARRKNAKRMAEVEADRDGVRAKCQSFAEFVRYAWEIIEPATELKWNWHLDAMCDHLEAISRGEIRPRIIINVPPGSSKSTIVTVLWQAWEWGPLGKRHLRYVTTSFERGNVKRDVGKTADVLMSEWFTALWPEAALKRAAAYSFKNRDTGTRLGVAFKSITGKRGDRLVVDDPHSLEGAESDNQRDKTVTNFIEGGLNRINDWSTSAIVIVMQRLHENDLTGELLRRDYGFIHLMLPMEFEPSRRCTTPLKVTDPETGEKKDWTDPRSYMGEVMDPVRNPPGAIEDTKKSGEYMWAGQYQQRPAPREGGIFKVDELVIVESCPPGGDTVSGWDFAGSKRKTSPYSVRVFMTRIGGDIYIRHVVRKRTNPTELETLVKDTSTDDRAEVPGVLIDAPQDPGYGGKAVKWRLAEILIGFKYSITPEQGDKVTRAEPFAAQVGAGRVHLVRGEWNSQYIEELRNFPGGSFKDQVDASSRAFQALLGKPKAPSNAGPEEAEPQSTGSEQPVPTKDPWGG